MLANYRVVLILVLLACDTVPTLVYDQPGDFIIGGLLPLHEEKCWKLRELETLHRLEAMVFAVNQLNNRSDILPGITLGFRIYDTCSYEPTTVARATLFIPDTSGDNCATCDSGQRADQKPVIGVIGTELSSTTLAAAQLFGVYKIPLVSFFATSDDLSDTGRYPYFLRIVPPDKLQVEAMIDMLKYFGWTYVSIIYSGDSYGRNALNNFRQQLIFSPNLCLGVEFEVDSDTSELVMHLAISHILSRADTAKVVILFTQTSHANAVLRVLRDQEAQGKIQLLGSDGWGMSIGEIDSENREMALGAIKTQLHAEEVPEFEGYFTEMAITSLNNSVSSEKNPWLWKFRLQYGLNCLSASGCDQAYGRGFSKASGVSRVIDTVRIYAYGLDDMIRDYCLKTTNSTPPCNVSSMVVPGVDLFQRMKQVLRPESRYGDMFSRKNMVKERYELEVIAKTDDDREYELKPIGEWEVKGLPHVLNLTNFPIPWGAPGDGGEYNQPSSYCSKPCLTGEIATGIGDRTCCWQCTPCAPRDIVINGTICKTCEDKEVPDESRVKCNPVEPLYIHWSDPIAIVLTVITSFGILITCLTFTSYVRNNHQPLIKASSRELSYLMLVGVLLSYLVVFSFFGTPSVTKCYIIKDGFMMGFTFTYAPLLTRANRIYRIFRAGKKSAKRPSLISPRSQIVIALGLITIQLIISISWQISDPPAPVEKIPTPGMVEIMCNIKNGEMVMSLIYNVILVLLCSVHAFMTRKVPNNYNESRFISLSVYTTFVIWLAFIPCYFLLSRAVFQLVVMAVALIISGSITLAFMFFPKLYAVHFVSEDNVRAAGTYREQASMANGNGTSSGNKLSTLPKERCSGGTLKSLMPRSSSVAPAPVAPEPAALTPVHPHEDEGQTVKAETMRHLCFHSLATQAQDEDLTISCSND